MLGSYIRRGFRSDGRKRKSRANNTEHTNVDIGFAQDCSINELLSCSQSVVADYLVIG
jgi:hypothetical protein